MIGYLQLLQEGIYGDLSPKQREVLHTIETQGHTLGRLTKHLLDISRFEAGGSHIEPRPIRLEAFIDDLERAFHVLAIQREVRFLVTKHDGLPDEVIWDADRMNEVIGNLLANSFKFTPRGGAVELRAEPAGDEGVTISVHDTGAGIPPDQLPRIFQKFYQADNQRAAAHEGTGLGLAIAKEIVEAHRGVIRADSSIGEGTTFQMVLPRIVRRRSFSHMTTPAEVAS
jgi:two-component system sensor histidine kinase ResE